MLIRNFAMLAVSTSILCNAGCDKPGATEQQKENSAAEQNPNRRRSKIIQAALIEIARQTDSFNLLIYRP